MTCFVGYAQEQKKMNNRHSLYAVMLGILFLVPIVGWTQPMFAERVDSGVRGMIFEHNVAVTIRTAGQRSIGSMWQGSSVSP
jgi:hypothetical protein